MESKKNIVFKRIINMGMLGSKKGLEWWGKVSSAKWKLKQLEEKLKKSPNSKSLKQRIETAKDNLLTIEGNYYD